MKNEPFCHDAQKGSFLYRQHEFEVIENSQIGRKKPELLSERSAAHFAVQNESRTIWEAIFQILSPSDELFVFSTHETYVLQTNPRLHELGPMGRKFEPDRNGATHRAKCRNGCHQL